MIDSYLQSLYGIPILPIEEEHNLSKQIQAGDALALERLITHNLRFVVFVVRKLTAWQYSHVPVEDLISMGNEHLIIAGKRWKPTNNSRFATYAKPFIERGVVRELDNTTNIIRLPVGIMSAIKKMAYIERTLGAEATVKRVAEKMEVSEERIYQLKSYLTFEPTSIVHEGQSQEEEYE